MRLLAGLGDTAIHLSKMALAIRLNKAQKSDIHLYTESFVDLWKTVSMAAHSQKSWIRDLVSPGGAVDENKHQSQAWPDAVHG